MRPFANSHAPAALGLAALALGITGAFAIWSVSSQRRGASAPGALPTIDDAGECPRAPVVIIGASYARGWTPARRGLEFVNLGVAGQQSFEMLARFDDALGLQPRAVIIWGFINDVFRTPRGQLQGALAETRGRLREMVDRAAQGGIEPILATELTIRHPAGIRESAMWLLGKALGRSSYQDHVNAEVMQVNEWVRAFAAERRLLLLDLGRVLSDAGGERRAEYAEDDGSHVSRAGYEAIDGYALPLLRQQLCQTAGR